MKRVKTRFKVNGKTVELELEPRRLLVSVLRDDLGLTGTHHGCDTTNCGACTVLMDGKAVKSCTVLGVQADGKEILTIEGLARQRSTASDTASFYRKTGASMRLLDTWHDYDQLLDAEPKQGAGRRRNKAHASRQHLQVHGLPRNC